MIYTKNTKFKKKRHPTTTNATTNTTTNATTNATK
jgi:hypothetical protein